MTSVTVLAYHAVGRCAPADDPHNLWVSPEAFRRHLAYLARSRRVVSLADAVDGRVEPGRPAVVVTFDDGYRSVLENAVPLLECHGFPATVFVPTKYIGDGNRWDPPTGCPLDIMTEGELRQAARRGLAVESHGHSHLDFSGATFEVARDDLAPSLGRLAAVTGRRPRFLAYPFRAGSEEAQRAAAAVGFDAAFTIDLPHAGRFAWARVSVSPHDSVRLLAVKTSGRWPVVQGNPLLWTGYRVWRRLHRR
ncbi:MAG: polysaccharide deacetylase family protein [Actinomycetota bacterium]|nr:polysaccharide deacetylase family protein [Actinomycetota bacterium]